MHMEMKTDVSGILIASTAQQKIKIKTTIIDTTLSIYEISISKSILCKVNMIILEFLISSLFS